MASPPLLLVLDGNSLLHRAYHAAATGKLLDSDDRPVWALKGLVGYVARATAKLRPDAVVVGFDCGEHSTRQADYPPYKAHRPEKAGDLAEQITAAPDLVKATGLCTVVPRGYEADDVLASAASEAKRAGWRSVLVTSDRDAFALIDEHTAVMRVRNGGLDEAVMVTPAMLQELYGVAPAQYRDLAALRGDPSDNLPGVRGFGTILAGRLLGAFGTVEAAWEAGFDDVRAVVGDVAAKSLDTDEARVRVELNRRLMRMRSDLEIPELDSARLPVSYGTMRQALAARGIILGPSLWALTGRTPPPEPDPEPPKYPRSVKARREPSPDQLALF
ncbi:5'-3' exonuclease [Cryptosporangium phraense]|uniref:5'-3' exonuclease n=1 Tax=Cryptosporangium phraense TaxID=2593070 RepID=A0A545AG85_9ACTN|nr:5'-3' exonuclease H3TH domain-containing protein [Cryptosporangium phraense]TQS40346.1 flap endonuclease [Cryptosporangium phraense]